MKKVVTIVGTFCVLLVLALSVAATPAEPKDILAEVIKLRNEVLSLRERVEALEKCLKNATIIFRRVQPLRGDSILTETELFHQRGHIPKDWQKRQFNGMTYYIIPIGQDKGDSSHFDK